MGNAIGCCADEGNGAILEKGENINLSGRKVLFGKTQHDASDSSDEGDSYEESL